MKHNTLSSNNSIVMFLMLYLEIEVEESYIRTYKERKQQ